MRRREVGFTLIEVVIALAILALGLGVLLHAEASALSAAGRTRGLTYATLLARSKMIDVEQRLFDEGFTMGDVEDEGDFNEEAHPEIKWKSRVIEVQLDLDILDKLGGEGEGKPKGGGATAAGLGGDLAGAAGALGGPLQTMTKQMGESMRVIELTVTYPSDRAHFDTLKVRSVVTRDDLGNKNAPPPGTALGQPIPPPGNNPNRPSQ
jgi:general secretion pathway protein I